MQERPSPCILTRSQPREEKEDRSMRLRSIPQSVSNRLAPSRASFKSAPAQHFNIWCWLLVTLIVASSGQVKTLTRYMPTRVAYWTTLRMVRAKVWNEQALLELLVADILSCLPPRTSLKQLVYFAKLRWRMERAYEELNQELGLGHDEGRKWRRFHPHATMCIAASALLVAERGLFPLKELEANLDSRKLEFPEVNDPEAPPVRPERHNPTSIATLHRELIVGIVRCLQRCPCCQRRNGIEQETFDELIE